MKPILDSRDGRLRMASAIVQPLGGAIAFFLITSPPLRAQTPEINALKGKIFDARMAQQTFADGLPYCNELDGTNFYFRARNRVLNLNEYSHSLENLAKAGAYNAETHRPWTLEAAKARLEQVKKEGQEDKEKCELVKSLPGMEKQLKELQTDAAASNKNAPTPDPSAAAPDRTKSKD